MRTRLRIASGRRLAEGGGYQALACVVVSRLAQQHADLHRALTEHSLVEQRAAVERLVSAAVRANGLSFGDASAAGAVKRFDDQAWDVQQQVERGEAAQEEYEAAFRRARAASAAWTLADPTADLADAAYEAVHALLPDVDLHSLIGG
jgi:hypothetical protein